MSETVNHPKHYNDGKIEVIEFIEDKGLGFHLGNAVKYICRAGKKDPTKYVEDLEKAIWYIRRRIELKSDNPRRPNDMNPREGGALAKNPQLFERCAGKLKPHSFDKDGLCVTCGVKENTVEARATYCQDENDEQYEKK